MTLHYEITKMLHRGEEIVIDQVTLRAFLEGKSETVDHLVEGEWIPYKFQTWYRNYRISLNPERMQEMHPAVYNVLYRHEIPARFGPTELDVSGDLDREGNPLFVG